jgi:hypothetical protein
MDTVLNQSLSGKEAFSAVISLKHFPEMLGFLYEHNIPPLWNLWEWIVFNTLGSDEIYIRGLALVFFLGTAAFAYKTGSFLWSPKTGLLAAIFTLINPYLFKFAFEGWFFTSLTLGVAASVYFFLRIFRNDERIRRRDKIGYVFFTLWALYSHQLAFFAITMQGIWWFYELVLGKRNRAKKMLKVFLITGVGYAPWLLPLYNQITAGNISPEIPAYNNLENTLIDYLTQGIKNENLRLPIVNMPLYQASLYLLAAVIAFRKWWKGIKKTIFLILCFLGPIIFAWLISQKLQPVYIDQYLLYTIPSAILILVSSRSKISIILLTLLAIFFGIIDYDYFVHPKKPSFKQYSEHIQGELGEGDFIVNWNTESHHLWETKYYGFPAPVYIPPKARVLPPLTETILSEEDIIGEIPETAERVGVVISGAIEEVYFPGYTKKSSVNFDDLKLLWYEKDK